MLHAGLDLGRRRLDVCLLSEQGEQVDQLAAPPDVDSLRTLARRIDGVHGQHVCAVVESMTGARLVHDTLEQEGWSVEIADAQKVIHEGAGRVKGRSGASAGGGVASLAQVSIAPSVSGTVRNGRFAPAAHFQREPSSG